MNTTTTYSETHYIRLLTVLNEVNPDWSGAQCSGDIHIPLPFSLDWEGYTENSAVGHSSSPVAQAVLGRVGQKLWD